MVEREFVNRYRPASSSDLVCQYMEHPLAGHWCGEPATYMLPQLDGMLCDEHVQQFAECGMKVLPL